MQGLVLLKFNQSFIPNSEHWGILLPDQSQGVNSQNIPKAGTLFHVDKDGYFVGRTNYRRDLKRDIPNIPTLQSALTLPGTERVTYDILDQACIAASKDRSFNMFLNNCQNWVVEVLLKLAARNHIPKTTLEYVKKNGWGTARDRSIESCGCTNRQLVKK
jgi:hypothetical protein